MIQKQFKINMKYKVVSRKYKIERMNINLEQLADLMIVRNSIKICILSTVFFLMLSSCKSNKNLQTSSYYQPNYQTGTYDKKEGLGFQLSDKLPIEVLIGDEEPQTATEVIEKLSISDETPIQDGQLYKGRMLNRGNDQQQKKALLDRMIAQAQDLGASGLMKVNYKVFTTAKTTGYTLSGTAFKYILQK